MVVLHHSGHRVPTMPPRANYLRGVVPNEGHQIHYEEVKRRSYIRQFVERHDLQHI